MAIGYGSLLLCNVGITSAGAKAFHLHNNNNNNNNNNDDDDDDDDDFFFFFFKNKLKTGNNILILIKSLYTDNGAKI